MLAQFAPWTRIARAAPSARLAAQVCGPHLVGKPNNALACRHASRSWPTDFNLTHLEIVASQPTTSRAIDPLAIRATFACQRQPNLCCGSRAACKLPPGPLMPTLHNNKRQPNATQLNRNTDKTFIWLRAISSSCPSSRLRQASSMVGAQCDTAHHSATQPADAVPPTRLPPTSVGWRWLAQFYSPRVI